MVSHLKGASAIMANVIFTDQSANARDTHRGAKGPMPRMGSISLAQATSVAGWMNAKWAEKAIEKNIAVSIVLLTSVEIRGAFHHVF